VVFTGGSAFEWGSASTTTILNYQISFESLPKERLTTTTGAPHHFAHGSNALFSVAGFKVSLKRKVKEGYCRQLKLV